MKYIIKLSFFRNMNIVFYFTYKKFSISKANEKGKNQQFLHLDNWHNSTIFNRLLLYYFLLSLLHLLFYFISFKIIWINLNHMNYYFFLQSLFKKKLKTFISVYLFQTSFYFLQSYIHIQCRILSHTKPSQTIPSSVQSADTNHKQILAYGCNRSTITASRTSKNWRTRSYESIERIFQRKTKP